MKRRLLICVLLMCGLTLGAVPARHRPFVFTQPDGSRITLCVSGDERCHLTKTTDGYTVVKDDNGFYCYASRDAAGRLVSSACPVGKPASAEVLSSSRSVQYVPAVRRIDSPQAVPSAVQTLSNYNVYVILVEFQDLKFTHTAEEFQNLLSKKGYSAGGATGSVLDYFDAQCNGKLSFKFDVSPIVTLSKGYAYYGKDDEDGYDEHPEEAVREACNLLDPQVDFSQYNVIFIYYAGGNTADGGADEDHIWPHMTSDYKFRYDGQTFGCYAMSSELEMDSYGAMQMASIGTFCHEFAHVLGLPDFYDTDYEKSGGQADALWGTLSLMDSGNYNNEGRTPPNFTAAELEMLGIVGTEYLGVGDYVLEPQSSVKRVLRADTFNPGEYFLFECRASTGWDKYIGGSGLLVYHVDKSSNSAGYSEQYKKDMTASQRWSWGEVNANPEHQCLDLIEAKAQSAEGDIDRLKLFFPYPFNAVSTLSSVTNPSLTLWNGVGADIALTRIRKSGSNVSFTVTGPMTIDEADVFQDAVIVNWHVENSAFFGLESKIKWIAPDGTENEALVRPYDQYRYSYTIEGLSPRTFYTIVVSSEKGGETISAFKDVKTTSYNGKPYIYLNSAERFAGAFVKGTKLPLRVCNAVDAVDVQWYLGSRRIYPGRDGYYLVESSGDLRAVITYQDGSRETIYKTITLAR